MGTILTFLMAVSAICIFIFDGLQERAAEKGDWELYDKYNRLFVRSIEVFVAMIVAIVFYIEFRFLNGMEQIINLF